MNRAKLTPDAPVDSGLVSSSGAELLSSTIVPLIGAVREAAARVLSTALATGEIGTAVDSEAVHDLRVALRRLRTLLRPARLAYGRKRMRAIEEQLRAQAQSTGALRDEEVLRETLASLDIPPRWRGAVDRWLEVRARQERSRRRAVAACLRGGPKADHGRLLPVEETLARLERRLKPRSRCPAAHALAQSSLREAVEGARAFAAVDARDVRGLHALRIRFKRLRYTAELFAKELGPGAEVVARSASKMQRRLGDIHDCDAAVSRIARARSLSSRARAAVISQLRHRRAELVTRALAELKIELARIGEAAAELEARAEA